MTSFTRKLFVRDPAAEAAYHDFQRAQRLDQPAQPRPGSMATFATLAAARLSGFVSPLAAVRQGGRTQFGHRPRGQAACATLCGHPACKHGCTGIGRQGA